MKKLWYYTSVMEVEKIIRHCKIKLSKKGNLNNAVPCIWLSSNPEWQTPPDVIYIYEKEFHESTRELMTRARIEIFINTDIKDWSTYKSIADIDERMRKPIERLARMENSKPREWYYSSKSISQNQWGKIEYLVGDKWIEFSPDKLSVRHKP